MSQTKSKPKKQRAPREHTVQSSLSTDECVPRRLTLVPAPVAERQPLPAVPELRDLIRSLQKQHAAHRPQPKVGRTADEPLSAA